VTLAYADSAQDFENEKTRALLQSANIYLPAPETYLDRILAEYEAARAGS